MLDRDLHVPGSCRKAITQASPLLVANRRSFSGSNPVRVAILLACRRLRKPGVLETLFHRRPSKSFGFGRSCSSGPPSMVILVHCTGSLRPKLA